MCGLLGKLVWFLTAVSCVYIGLMALGYDLLALAGLSRLALPVHYAIGVVGLVSLVLLVWGCICSECER